MKNSTVPLLVIDPADSVGIAPRELHKGDICVYGDRQLTVLEDVPTGHKVALRDIRSGEKIIKYGHPISHAVCDISRGGYVHTHNTATNLGKLLDYSYTPAAASAEFSGAVSDKTFMGYKRRDGRVGIRNEVWIIPTVGCVNETARILAEKAGRLYGGRCDGIYAYTHGMGCSQMGEDQAMTQRILAGLISNPNAGAVLVLSLGCENNNLSAFTPFLGDYDKDRVKFLVTQDEEDEYASAMELLDQLTAFASGFKRSEQPLGKLCIGMKCGGSDAFSGITANPLCGRISNTVVKNGGVAMLTEVPEMFGAEDLLMARAVNEDVFNDIVRLINGHKQYFTRYHQTIYENPSPGNKMGGISTLEEKSLGCTQKGGSAPVVRVLELGEQASVCGLNLLHSPANDPMSCTNLAASGAVMIIFTTGRGTPFGACVPTVKVSSNSRLYQRKKCWIDFDAGPVLDGVGLDSLASDFLDYLISVMSGKQTLNELHGYREISVFRDGVVL